MKRRAIRLLVLLWLGWYISGPAFETVDFWDSPQEELSDVVRSAGGFVALIGVVLCFAIGLFRKLRDGCLAAARAIRHKALPFILQPLVFPPFATSTIAHSPPTPLRI